MHCPQRPKRSWAFFLVILRFVLSCPFFNFFGLCICFCVCAVLKSLNCLVGLEFVWLGLFSEMGFWNSSHVLDSMWDNVELYCWVFAEFVNENCTFCCLAGKNCIKKRERTIFDIFENMTVNEVERDLVYWVLQILVQSWFQYMLVWSFTLTWKMWFSNFWV